MSTPRKDPETPARRLLQEVPGIADVVWGALARLDGRHEPMRIVFVSAESSAGTTVLAATTAIGLVRHLRVPVALIEANVERPALAGYLGLRTAGLTDVLDGRAELADCLQEPRDCQNLKVLPAGTPRAPRPGELTTDRLHSILASAGEGCRYLVVDAPPVLDHLESRLLLQHGDGAILVLRAGATRKADAERAHRILLETGTPVLGSIFNAYRPEHPFRRTARHDRPRTWDPAEASTAGIRLGTDPPILTGESTANGHGLRVITNGWPEESNGSLDLDENLAPGADSEETHRSQVDILERRIAKLTKLLEQTEENLRRIAAMKDVDLGIASIYRTVQGLSSEGEAQAYKRQLMKKIFQANLELKSAIARMR